MHARTIVSGAVSLALLVTNTANPQSGGAAMDDSPQAVFLKYYGAMKKQDWKTFADCLTDESREYFASSMCKSAIQISDFVKAGAVKEEEVGFRRLQSILSAHGRTEETLAKVKRDTSLPVKDLETAKKVIKILAGPIKDKATFIGDMLRYTQETLSKKKAEPFEKELKELKIDGSTATGVAVSSKGGKERREPIAFKRVGKAWRVDLPIDEILTKLLAGKP